MGEPINGRWLNLKILNLISNMENYKAWRAVEASIECIRNGWSAVYAMSLVATNNACLAA